MPKVSVIIPTYNRSQKISETLNSVLSQTYANLDIIVVDDNSSDNTKDVMDYYLNKDSRIRYFKHNKNLGAPVARNTGIKNARGEFIALLDDDDQWHPQKIEKQLQVFEKNHNAGLVCCGFEVINSEGKIIATRIPTKKGNIYTELLNLNIIGSPTNLIKRECFSKIGYCDHKLKSCQDWDLWIRISKHFEIDFVPEILAYYYISQTSISQNIDSVIAGQEQILNKYEEELKKHNKIYCNHLRDIGILYKYKKDYAMSKKYLEKTLKLYPLNPRAIVHYLSLLTK